MDGLSANERLYLALKKQLTSERPAPEGRLFPQTLADLHRVSVTPVREALFRLAGERLVELRPDGGFRQPDLDPVRLADLHAWNGQHLLAALHVIPDALIPAILVATGELPHSADHHEVVRRVEVLFEAIGAATGNREFLFQIEGANDRLRSARLAEQWLFADSVREFRALVRRDHSSVRSNVRRRIHVYHRRRIEHAGQLAVLLRRG